MLSESDELGRAFTGFRSQKGAEARSDLEKLLMALVSEIESLKADINNEVKLRKELEKRGRA